MLTYEQVGKMIGGEQKPLSERQLRRLVRSGRLKAVKITHSCVRFRPLDVEAFIKQSLV